LVRARDEQGAPAEVGEPGRDVVVEVEIDFEQAVVGAELTLDDLELWVECDECKGTGEELGSKRATCTACSGTGEITERRRSLLGSMITSYLCPECEGEGTVVVEPCKKCGGESRILHKEKLTVPIQPGIEDGTQLRVPGRGHAGVRGGPSGDLYISVRVRPHPVLKRSGADLFYDVVISYVQAVLGTEVLVPTLDGDLRVRIPGGVSDGEELRLVGHGVPRLDRGGRGDLVIKVRVVIPSELDPEERALLERIAEIRRERVLKHDHSAETAQKRI